MFYSPPEHSPNPISGRVANEDEGFLRRTGLRKYSSNVHLLSGKRFRIGYASEGNDSFSNAVSHGLRWAQNRDLHTRSAARDAISSAMTVEFDESYICYFPDR
jgi:hypothetical protein